MEALALLLAALAISGFVLGLLYFPLKLLERRLQRTLRELETEPFIPRAIVERISP